MKVKEIRSRNLAKVIEKKFKSQREFCAVVEKPPPHVNGWIKGTRAFGEPLARFVEQKIGLRSGYLDEENPLTDEALALAIKFMELSDVSQAKLTARMIELETLDDAYRAAQATQTASGIQG